MHTLDFRSGERVEAYLVLARRVQERLTGDQRPLNAECVKG